MAARGDFTVVVRPEDAYAGDEPVEPYDGSGQTALDIVLPSAVYAAGQWWPGRSRDCRHSIYRKVTCGCAGSGTENPTR